MSNFGSLAVNVVRFLLNLLTRNLLNGVLVYSCCIPIWFYNYWFSWHVILCTLGMIPFMTEALLLFPPDELWSKQISRKQKYWIHGTLFLVGTILVSAGCIDTFYFIEDGYHLYTIHGITGLVSMIFFIISLVVGISTNYSIKLQKFIRPLSLKFLHNFLGLIAYIVGIVSLCYSFYSDWFVYYTSYESRLVALIATIVGSLWTLNGSLVSGYNQIKVLLNL